MECEVIQNLCQMSFNELPHVIERCAVGQANYVYFIECSKGKFIVRCSEESGSYKDTVYWLERLAKVEVPVPKMIAKGNFQGYEYVILSYLEGRDLGLVYTRLTRDEKRIIAQEVVQIQNRVALLELEDVKENWTWYDFLDEMFERAKMRIAANGYFDIERVERLQEQTAVLQDYFGSVQPVAYLDDITTKNLLIHNGQMSGVIDVDWIGIGDKLTFVAMTYIALLNMQYDTEYVDFLLEEMQISDIEKNVFLFYSLMFCVDFMGERGMQFMDKRVEVNEQIVKRLNDIYDNLWEEWCSTVLGGV